MAWFGKVRPALARVPTRWTPALWETAVGGLDGRFDTSIVVRARREVADWHFGSRRLTPDVTYLGALEREPGDPLGLIPVDLRFDTSEHPDGQRYATSETLGLVYTGALGNAVDGHALLSVRLWGDEAGAAVFGAAFDRALAAGHDGLRVWTFAQSQAVPIEEVASGFAVVQPVTRIRYEHDVRLGRLRRR